MKQNRPFSPGVSRGSEGAGPWEGELEGTDEGGGGGEDTSHWAGLGVSVHHCASLLVCSQQTGHLSGHGLQVSSFQQGCGTRARGGGCAAAWELKALLGSVRARSCLEGAPSLGRGGHSLCRSSRWASWSRKQVESPALGCPSPPLSTQASFPESLQLPALSLLPPGVCRPGLPPCLLLSLSKADLGRRNVPGMRRVNLASQEIWTAQEFPVRGSSRRDCTPSSWLPWVRRWPLTLNSRPTSFFALRGLDKADVQYQMLLE